MRISINGTTIQHHANSVQTGKKVAVVFDSDRTLIPIDPHPKQKEYLEGNLSAISDNKEFICPASVITGRGNDRIKIFSRDYEVFTPFDFYLSTDSGKGGIFYKPQNESTDRWLVRLNTKDKVPHWQDSIEAKLGWKQRVIIDFLKKNLQRNKFHETRIDDPIFDRSFTKDGLEILFIDDQAIFTVKIVPMNKQKTEKDIKRGLELANQVASDLLNELKVKVTVDAGGGGEYFFIDFRPELQDNRLINKFTITELILDGLGEDSKEDLIGAIMLGDSINDEHLKISEIAHNGRIIPAFAIHSGSDLLNNSAFNTHPRIRLAEEKANIGQALRSTILEIFYSC